MAMTFSLLFAGSHDFFTLVHKYLSPRSHIVFMQVQRVDLVRTSLSLSSRILQTLLFFPSILTNSTIIRISRNSFITGEDPMLSDQQQYRYMTVDDMKSMGDDSMRVNVTDDERDNRHSGGKHYALHSNHFFCQSLHIRGGQNFVSPYVPSAPLNYFNI